MPKSKQNRGKLIVGLILVILGTLIFLDNNEAISINIPDYVFSWKVLLIFIGTMLLLGSGNKTAGSILIFIGAISLLPEFWPLILVGIGVYMLLKQTKTGEKISKGVTGNSHSNSDSLNELFLFSGAKKIVQTDNFKGGRITSIFGGGEIDLLDCKLAPGENYLELTSIFGGSTIIVPKDWYIDLRITAFLGGFGDSRIKEPNQVYDKSKVLVITGEAIFGGGEIKN